MRHRKYLLKLSKKCKPRMRMLRNLVTSLVQHQRIRTTKAKARAMRGLADYVVAKAKKTHLTQYRKKQLLGGILYSNHAVDKLLNQLSVKFQDQNGNFAWIKHDGYRKGDGAKMSVIQYRGNPYQEFQTNSYLESPAAKIPEFTLKILYQEKEFLQQIKLGTKSVHEEAHINKQLEKINREIEFLQVN